nr:insulin-related peptide I:SUBUNIT=C peptide [Lymnaea stagnalis]
NAETDLDDPLRNIKLSSESALTYLY